MGKRSDKLMIYLGTANGQGLQESDRDALFTWIEKVRLLEVDRKYHEANNCLEAAWTWIGGLQDSA